METTYSNPKLISEQLIQLPQETDKTFQEIDQKITKLMKKTGITESPWGKFVEALVEGSLVKMLNKNGIMVNETALREKRLYEGREFEVDIVARNGIEIVVIEVKTTLSPQDVKDFIEKLKVFKKVFPRYKDNVIYGGMAYINKDGDSNIMAEKKGLLVIKATGESGKITNSKDFKPKAW